MKWLQVLLYVYKCIRKYLKLYEKLSVVVFFFFKAHLPYSISKTRQMWISSSAIWWNEYLWTRILKSGHTGIGSSWPSKADHVVNIWEIPYMDSDLIKYSPICFFLRVRRINSMPHPTHSSCPQHPVLCSSSKNKKETLLYFNKDC